MTSASSQSSPIEGIVLPTFARGVFAILHSWPALRIAIQQGCVTTQGAAEGRTALAEDLVDLFYTTVTSGSDDGEALSEVPDLEDIEDVLLHIVSHMFRVSLEDGSEATVAKDLIGLWKECVARARNGGAGAGDAGLMEKFEAAATKAKAEDGEGRKIQVHIEDGSSDDDDGEDSDEEMEGVEEAQTAAASAPAPRQREAPQIDEDGFETVTKKKGGRR